LPFDPKQAAADLDAAGWKMHQGTRMRGDTPLELELAFVGPSSEERRLATELQAQLHAIGIAVSLHGYPTTLIFAPASAGGIGPGGRFNLQSTGWYGGSDPEASEGYTCAMRAPNGPNYSRWCSPQYDRLYALQKASDDPKVRMQAFSGMQRLVRDASVADFIAYPALYTAVNPALANFRPNMLFEFWNSDEWDMR
jgi:peptide/nickel transport system substrate-binding protein